MEIKKIAGIIFINPYSSGGEAVNFTPPQRLIRPRYVLLHPYVIGEIVHNLTGTHQNLDTKIQTNVMSFVFRTRNSKTSLFFCATQFFKEFYALCAFLKKFGHFSLVCITNIKEKNKIFFNISFILSN